MIPWSTERLGLILRLGEGAIFGSRDANHPMPARLKLEDAQASAEENGGRRLSKEYVNLHTLMEWECAVGHQWTAKYLNIRSKGGWCSKCAKLARQTEVSQLGLNRARRCAASSGGACSSEAYANNKQLLHWRCSKTHEWKASYNSVGSRRETRWRICAVQNQAEAHRSRSVRSRGARRALLV
jgi:hypothetical protein